MSKKRLERAKQVKAAYERVFETEDGKTVLEDLMGSCGITASSLDLNAPDALTMAYNDGAKSVVHRIIYQIQLKPEKYLEMINPQGDEDVIH